MTELEKMAAGELYDFSTEAIDGSVRAARRKLQTFNRQIPGDEGYAAALRDLLPAAHPTAVVVPPFFCDHGYPIRLGEGVFVNGGATMLDGGGIEIGARTKVGPDCKFYTPQHPIDYLERRRPVERGLKIVVGEDCWLGGNVTVCPGVTIGARTIVGAGSVVVKDLPDDVLAAGNPAVVKRKLREP